MNFLETGSKKTKRPNDAEATVSKNKFLDWGRVTFQTLHIDCINLFVQPSKSPGSKKQKKSSSKRKKSEALKFDFEKPPTAVSWICTNAPEETWTARVDNKRVAESRQREWAAAFEHVTQPKPSEGASN